MLLVLIVATALMLFWLVQLGKVEREDWIVAAYNKILNNQQKIEKLQDKSRKNRDQLATYHGLPAKVMAVFLKDDSEKTIYKLQKENQSLQQGDLRSISILAMPGFALQRRFDKLGKGEIQRKLIAQYTELYGKKYAPERAKQLVAQMLSYPIIGVAAALLLGVLLLASGNKTGGLAVMIVGSLLVLVVVYAFYDEVADLVKKRREAISRQFPNVVSKLALLVTSGMIVDKAWKQTAYSQELVLYQEMRKTSDELDNLVEPTAAYTNFLGRCNTKETTKLASALIQSQSKGNAEIGALLKGMAHDAWQERRHTAKRDSEKANSKLMIPTMLLFVAILVMIMVPVAMNFMSL